MRDADQRFPMPPYRALYAVTHRNESGTGHANYGTHKTLILRGKSANFFSDIIAIPTANLAQSIGAEMIAGAA